MEIRYVRDVEHVPASDDDNVFDHDDDDCHRAGDGGDHDGGLSDGNGGVCFQTASAFDAKENLC